MQTVTFRCGHCTNLMAVSTNYLGQQVRCPTCQKVVVAPTSSTPPAAPPASMGATSILEEPRPRADQDSIFEPPEDQDDLFGQPQTPRLEIPPPSPAPPPPPPVVPPPPSPDQATLVYTPPPDQTPPLPGPNERTLTYVTPQPPTISDSNPAPSGALRPPPPVEADNPFAPSPTASAPDAEVEELARAAHRETHRTTASGGGGWITAVIIIPLISYSVLVTVMLALAYIKPPPPHPLEMIPDVGNGNPAAKKGKLRTEIRVPWGERPLLKPLPAKLRARLGQPLVIGDLKVTPLGAELRKINFRVPGALLGEGDPGRHDSLVLYLELQNVSADVYFRPLDPFFDRRRPKGGIEINVPFTYLVMGENTAREKRFYGGPCDWDAKARGTSYSLEVKPYPNAPDGKLVQNVGKELGPGDKMTSFVCTDSEDADVAEELRDYTGPLLYRVQLRRGLVSFKDEEVSATAVVGVELSGRDVRRQ